MNGAKLTAKQHAFLMFIKTYIREHRAWPTYQVMCDHFGYRSPNSVTQNLHALEKKRYLRRDETGFRVVSTENERTVRIPIRGVITAGVLQEAIEADLGMITLDAIFPHLDRLYAIRVSGQSMIGADVHDGDYVLLVDDDLPQGGIGAVLYNGETSLKRVFITKRGLRLEAANPEYDDIVIAPDIYEEVRLLGRYVGHVDGLSNAGRAVQAA